MTDNSDIVLRWEIDNATARLATGKAESEVFNEGGFKWTAVVNRLTAIPNNTTDFLLRCDADHSGPWKCEVEATNFVLHATGQMLMYINKQRIVFDENSSSFRLQCLLSWDYLTSTVFNINGKVTVEFRIHIIRSDRGQLIADPAMFDAPNRMSNVILKIGEEKLHVSKEFLAVHSPVFETLFFGNFAENGKEEVEIKNVEYEEFLDLLHLIYCETMEITDHTILHILKLSDQFQMEVVVHYHLITRILKQSKKHLTQSKGIDVMKKLQLADQYNITSLRDHCLQSFTNSVDLVGKLKCPEAGNFSGDMKIAIYDRIKNL